MSGFDLTRLFLKKTFVLVFVLDFFLNYQVIIIRYFTIYYSFPFHSFFSFLDKHRRKKKSFKGTVQPK